MATVPNADTVGEFWLDQEGQIWRHVSYTALPTVLMERVDVEGYYIEGSIEEPKVTSLRRLVPEEPFEADQQTTAGVWEQQIAAEGRQEGATLTNESFEIFRQMKNHLDRLKTLDLQDDDIELITEVTEEVFALGKKAGRLDIGQDPAGS